MLTKRVLYLGGFEMPDGNAAAQRVLSIAKALQRQYAISFLGLTHSDNFKGIIDAFHYENLPYPRTIQQWVRHLRGDEELKRVREERPDLVIAYNFPALGLARLIRYCRRSGIKLIGDITEWYHAHNVLKWIDTSWRMRCLNKKMDGLIVISKCLDKYYENIPRIVVPPTIDPAEQKWCNASAGDSPDSISLLYAGSPGRGDKDRLENLLIALGNHKNLALDIVGISQEAYLAQFPETTIPDNVHFWGRLPHEETIAKLNASDFSVFFREPTRVNNAGFPTKFVEAQTSGIPVISNLFSDLGAYIEDGRNGFLAKSISLEDIDVVLAKVAKLHRGQIQEMKAYTKSLNRFDYHHYIEIMKGFIAAL